MVKVPQSPSIQYKTRKGDLVSYRELAANYYNIIKSSWNILDIVNRIPHYSKNLDLLNYTLQQRQLFSIKAKILDRLIPHIKGSISDKQYKIAILYNSNRVFAVDQSSEKDLNGRFIGEYYNISDFI